METDGREYKVVLKDGSSAPVFVEHWWPTKKWEEDFCPLPYELVEGAMKRHRKGMTVATVALPEGIVTAVTECGNPVGGKMTKRMGRKIAVGRLRKKVNEMGYGMVST